MTRVVRSVGVVVVLAIGCGDDDAAMTVDSGSIDSGSIDSGSTDSSSPDAGEEAGEDSGADMECVSVTGDGGFEPWLDLTFVGREFDAYEGARIRVVTGSAGRMGVAHTRVVHGSFSILLPRTFNNGLYNEVSLYVDDNKNDTCDNGEAQWGYVSGITQANMMIDATPEMFCVSGGGPQVGAGCRPWNEPPLPCYTNGQVDIQVPLPCDE